MEQEQQNQGVAPPTRQRQQQGTENNCSATMSEQPVQHSSMSIPDHQAMNANTMNMGMGMEMGMGMGMGMGIGLPIHQLNGELTFPNQDGTFPALPGDVDSNGASFPNIMMMPDSHMLGNNGNIPFQSTNGHDISADEIALYDRQIRLWGMQAQKKIRSANVLLITMRALANEVAKNLVLAGIGSLTIVDDHVVTEDDLGAEFFLSEKNKGQSRAQAVSENIKKLNPRVDVYADPGSIMAKGASYFQAFDIIIATDLNPTTLAFINTATRLYNKQFYAAGTHGFYGYIFSDLIEHDYVLQRTKGNVVTKTGNETRTRSVIDVKTKKEGKDTIEMVTKRELYSTWELSAETSPLPAEYRNSKRRLKAVTPALSCLRALWGFQSAQGRDPVHSRQDLEFFTKSATQNHANLGLPTETLRADFLRSFTQNIGSEIAPVAAILGGQLAQDVINVLGQSQPPIQNMVVFDGNTMQADMYPLHPDGTLGRAQLELGGMMATDMTMPAPVADPSMWAQVENMHSGPAL